MKKYLACYLVLLQVVASGCNAQNKQNNRAGDNIWEHWETIGSYISNDSVTRGEYTLIFINRDSRFAQKGEIIKKQMIDAFFQVYPEEVNRFNKDAARKVTFVIDPNYVGVAAAYKGIVKYSPECMLNNPKDIDVV